ncbi:MAG TPA: MFS transporter, partial [Devosia sp.]|nr:MFS transporter [Devosia sp.]
MSARTGALYDPPGGLHPPRRHWALAGLWLGMAMSVLDGSIANIALPSIGHSLGIPPAKTTWVVTAYQIAVVMALLPVAALGERIGYNRVYQAGMALFALMSLGCAAAPNLEILGICRFLQGVGAAAMMGVNGAQMRVTWPPDSLARGIGYNALVVSF